MKKIPFHKKTIFTFAALFSIIGYGVLVYAAAPSGGYAPGSTLNPDCSPGDTDCTVTILSGGGNNNPNSILYTDPNGLTTTDNLFTRNSATNLTHIGRTYSGTRAGDLTITLSPLFYELSEDSTHLAFQPGETINFENHDTQEISTGVYSGFGVSFPQIDTHYTKNFSGTGNDDLNFTFGQGYSDNGPVPATLTITVTNKDVPYFANESDYTGMFTIGETVTGQVSGATGTVIAAQGGLSLENISGTFEQNELLSGNSSGATVSNNYNGNPLTDVYSYDNGDISGFANMYRSPDYYDGGMNINFNYYTGHEIGDTWTVDITGDLKYIHVHSLSSSSINTQPQDQILYTATGQTSNLVAPVSLLLSYSSIASVGDEVMFLDFSTGEQDITGQAIITAINGNNYTLQITQGTYNINNLVVSNNGKFALLTAASTDPISYIINSGVSITDNAAGLSGLHGTVFEQTDGTVTGTMGALDATNIGGNTVMLGTNITTINSNASSYINQEIGHIINNVEGSNGNFSNFTLTPGSFRLSTNIGQGEVGFTVVSNNNNELLPAWFSGSNIQILPSSTGSNGQVLTTDGSGNLSWSGGSGGGSSAISVGPSGTTLYSSGLSGTGQDGSDNIFFGQYAGYGATNASNSNFLGYQSGAGATNASYSNFFGYLAGSGATDAVYSNFLGYQSGAGATNAVYSNFLGNSAGQSATDASNSNFLGNSAGYNATDASNSNFFGQSAGQNATNAFFSNFFGYNAGNGATGASNSNFLGNSAGYNATNASNSIFIGQLSGNNDLVNNTGDADDFSILIGQNTSTGGFSNSIAIGGSATNTKSNQFMIGSTTRPIDEIVMVGSGGPTCAIDINGTACSSDENLKTNITDLTTGTLDKVLNTKTVTFNWNNNTDTTNHIGFLAQDIQQYFPELVSTGSTGYLSVNYAGMTPVLVQAIREMNLKITTINDMDTPNTWRDSLIGWFGNASNGITKLFSKEIETKNLCVSDDTGSKTCITKAQLDQLLNNATNGAPSQIIITPNPTPNPDPGTGSDTDVISDPDTGTPIDDVVIESSDDQSDVSGSNINNITE